MSANSQNKKFIGFYNPGDFLFAAARFHLDTKIFVDSNLGNSIKGEDLSKIVFELGFKNIYLCTGYQASQFSDMPWIREVIGKEPYFPNHS